MGLRPGLVLGRRWPIFLLLLKPQLLGFLIGTIRQPFLASAVLLDGFLEEFTIGLLMIWTIAPPAVSLDCFKLLFYVQGTPM